MNETVTLNHLLVRAVSERVPAEVKLVNLLMEVLCLGKESVYRRLRGEIAFTFEEVVKLCSQFNISLDSVVGDKYSDGAMFNLQLAHTNNEIDCYREMLNYYANIYSYIAKDPNSHLSSASNILCFTLFPGYRSLTKYRLCRWMFQNEKLGTPSSLDQITIPQGIIEQQNKLSNEIKKIRNTNYIWDSNVFRSIIKEIIYFSSLDLISPEDVNMLKVELLQLLDELELLSLKGYNELGNPVSVYLSNLNFEASYSYAEREGFQICIFRVYSISSFDSQHIKICESQKKWINSLRRHSTLISQSGEIERRKFFTKQREIIESLKI